MSDIDTARDLTELWKAMGEAGIRPNDIEATGQSYCGYVIKNDLGNSDVCDIGYVRTLDILTGHAERWLRGRGWKQGAFWGTYLDPVRKHDCDLPAAIRAECGRGK
tara:strand:- start:394839 stop:395156 length:318 start_codon:yes stop_codon:yes gene_type:complete